MVLRDRKGMVAVMDAMLFLAVLGLTVSVLFVHSPEGTEGPDAREIHDLLFDARLRVSDVFDADDPRVLPLKDLIAIQIRTGEGRAGEYAYSVLSAVVPAPHGFMLRCEYEGRTLILGEEGEASSSHSSAQMSWGAVLVTELVIY